MSPPNRKENGLTYLAGERIAFRVVEKTADETQIRFIREKLSLVIFLAKNEFALLSVVASWDDYSVTFIRQHLCRNLSARIKRCRIDEIWRLVLNRLSQTVAKGRASIVAPKRSISIEQ